jgi:hypothetical protein
MESRSPLARIGSIKQGEGELMSKHIVHLIRERFYPLVRFCGPQSAGEIEIEGVRATVYLGEPGTAERQRVSSITGWSNI